MGSSIEIRMNHYKDSYEASSTMECNKDVFLKISSTHKISQVLWTVPELSEVNLSFFAGACPVPSSVMLIS